MVEGGDLTGALSGFCRFLRQNGMGLGTQATLDTLAVATGGLLMDRAHLFHGLRALLCHSREEFDNFASLFDAYWAGGDPIREKPATAFSPKNWQKLKALYLGGDGKQVGDVPASETIGASILESLLKVDLALVPERGGYVPRGCDATTEKTFAMTLPGGAEVLCAGETLGLSPTSQVTS